jgi:muramoyltetrapeptide carboxypeptidase LdcA involved in peptidoglycan recycling
VTDRELIYPPKPSPGDRVAVISPSDGLPGIFPAPFDLGLRRLREDFELEPVEYPTTRQMGAPLEDRAADVHAAFADPDIAAVLTSIGGDDQIKLLRHLDRDLLRDNPKPFFGWSDGTNLLHLLWDLGIVGYHGGAVMVQFGRAGAMHPATSESLRRALFTHDEFALSQPAVFTDEDHDWADPAMLAEQPPTRAAAPWSWHGSTSVVEGPSWGGCLEIVDFQLRVGRWVRDPSHYEGCVLFLETSEELPDATYVYRVLMTMGERGLLQMFPAILWGRAKAWSLDDPTPLARRAEYAQQQREAVLRAVEEYHPDAVLVTDLDIGHTDPQFVMPHGGRVVVDPVQQRISVTY